MNKDLKLIEKELDVQRLTEYNKALEFKHTELANSDDPSLDEPLQIDNISTLILEALIDAGYDTSRKLLILSASFTNLALSEACAACSICKRLRSSGGRR